MTYRMLGICFSAVVFAACSSDEQTPATGTDSGAGGSTGGSVSTGGKGGTGGAATGGANTGGSNTGGKATGGATGDGGPRTDASDASSGTGGAAGGGGTGGKGGAGGGATGGAPADAGGPCAALDACCQNLTGRQRTACTTIAATGTPGNCDAVSTLFCQDGGALGGGPGDAGGDGGGGCTALAACCVDSGMRGTQCRRVVARNDNNTCNQVAQFFCP